MLHIRTSATRKYSNPNLEAKSQREARKDQPSRGHHHSKDRRRRQRSHDQPLRHPPLPASHHHHHHSQQQPHRQRQSSKDPLLPTFNPDSFQMEHRHKLRPVQLFAPSSSNPNIFRLNKSALNAVLGHSSIANRKIVVVSVSGAYRKGKSFLLNFFLEYLLILQYSQKNDMDMDWLQDETQLEGFHYRSGTKRDTSGIWIWAEPIMIDNSNGERLAVLLMDTQGCFEQQQSTSNSNSNNANVSVLALSTLLSCIQLFNVSECIPEESIQLFKFFTDYEQLVSAEAIELGKPFQRLVMLVRDAKVSEEMVYGIDGGNRMLEKALKHTGVGPPPPTPSPFQSTSKSDGSSFISAALNPQQQSTGTNKQTLRQCFEQDICCYLLPTPGPKVVEQNSSFRGQVKDIKPLFRDEVRRVVECMIGPTLIKPKVFNGREITVRKWLEMVREYARIFESPDLPDARTLLNAHLQLSCVDYALEAKVAYCRGMDRITRSSRMMAEKKLLEAHIKHGVKALNIYDKCPKVESGGVRSKNLELLQESINHELERYKSQNEEKRVTSCASAMLACGDSALFGLGLGGAASGAVAATIVSLQMGIVSAGIVAIPVSLGVLCSIWVYVTLKPTLRICLGMDRN